MAGKRGGSTRKGKGDVLPPDFVGIIDEHGKVLIDDTTYFRMKDEQQPIWDELRAHPRYDELHEMIRSRLLAHGVEHNRDVGLRVLWLEQYIVGICAGMLRDARPTKKKTEGKR